MHYEATSFFFFLVNMKLLFIKYLIQEEGRFHAKPSSDERSRLEHAMMDAENSKKRAFEESVKRWRAEEDAMEAIHMVILASSFNYIHLSESPSYLFTLPFHFMQLCV